MGKKNPKKTLVQTYGKCAKLGKEEGLTGEELTNFVGECMLQGNEEE